MRKIKILEHISLDGVIQHSADDGDFPYSDWTAPYGTPAGRDAILAAYGGSFDLLLGRRTYDIWSGFWPKAPTSPMADGLNAAKKYVATHRPESLEWAPFEGLGPDIVEGIRRIKAQDGPDLILWGSSTLTSPLLEHGLADEVLLVVYPVLLGTGKRIFAEGTRHAHSSSSARKLWRRASSSAPTGPTDLCGPLPWAHRRKPTSESIGKREDSNEKANLRDPHDPGWLRRPHQTICR
jgi:dihydrofolate reductase